MKQFTIVRLLAIGLMAASLAACDAGSNVGSFVSVLTSSIPNPVTPTNIYQVKLGYAAADQLVVDYRAYCWSKSYAAVLADPIAKPLCQSRRAVVRAAQAARKQASNAIAAADTFIRNNPTLDASSVISAAWSAVGAFKTAVPAVK